LGQRCASESGDEAVMSSVAAGGPRTRDCGSLGPLVIAPAAQDGCRGRVEIWLDMVGRFGRVVQSHHREATVEGAVETFSLLAAGHLMALHMRVVVVAVEVSELVAVAGHVGVAASGHEAEGGAARAASAVSSIAAAAAGVGGLVSSGDEAALAVALILAAEVGIAPEAVRPPAGANAAIDVVAADAIRVRHLALVNGDGGLDHGLGGRALAGDALAGEPVLDDAGLDLAHAQLAIAVEVAGGDHAVDLEGRGGGAVGGGIAAASGLGAAADVAAVVSLAVLLARGELDGHPVAHLVVVNVAIVVGVEHGEGGGHSELERVLVHAVVGGRGGEAEEGADQGDCGNQQHADNDVQVLAGDARLLIGEDLNLVRGLLDLDGLNVLGVQLGRIHGFCCSRLSSGDS